MEKSSQHTPTLAELVAEFLLNTHQEDKEKNQVEVYKFVRWLGSGRKANELNPTDIANYGDRNKP